nr:hypothetical protein BaRGS_008183 [Batillaria attramentaria]
MTGEAQRVEKISLQHVQELLHRVEEVLGLWRVLLDHQFHTLSSALSQDQQNQLRSLSFKTLVLSGKDVCAALIACLISRYLDDNATVDAISSRLREVCPSLYSTDDATCSKANELLQMARVTQDSMERKQQLQEALRREDVLNMALKSTDMLFHSALYDWLFATNRSDKLLEIGTPFVERYLQRRANQPGDKAAALDMLWKFYEKNNNFTAAARILAQLSERHGMDLPLTRRLEYLSRAIMCAKSATSVGGAAASGEFLHELEEKMELYEDFADRFDLWECKLAIVHCAGLYDGALIENLWQNIIQKELSVGIRSDDQLNSVSERLVSIMKTYVTAERYFPLASIVRQLEQRSCELGLKKCWVFLTMLMVGISPPRLLELYDALFKSRDPFWQTRGQPLHLLKVLHELLSHLAKTPALIPPSPNERFCMICLDAVSSYLVELQAMTMDAEVRKLISDFKNVQARLERL